MITFKNIRLVSIAIVLFSCQSEGEKSSDHTTNKPSVFSKISSSESNIDFANIIKENVATMENLFNYDYFYNGAGVGVLDFDNDGLLDIFFCGNQVENKLYRNLGDFKFEDVSANSGINSNKTWSNGITVVDIDNDGWMDIYVSQGGPYEREKRNNLLFINQKDGSFKEMAEEFGLADKGISTQSVFFDFDGDGDLDCFVMNENEFYGVDPINLYKLVEASDENKYFNSSHLYENNDGKFTDITKQAGLERPIFGLGVTVSDINNDNLLDLYVASDYYIPDALFINNGDGTFTDQIKEYTNQISFYGMGVDIADINNDNRQDIFVLDMAANDHVRSKTLMASMNTARFDYLVKNAGFHHQYMYNSLQLNQGNNKFSNIAQLSNVANTDWSWSVLMADYDLDEDKDIFVTNGYRRYALDNDLQQQVFDAKMKYKGNVPLEIKKRLYESMPSEKLPNILFENDKNLQFSDRAKKWGLADFSFSNGAALGDLDNDGDLDLVVNNLDEEAFVYRNSAVENQLGNYLKVTPVGRQSESFAKISIHYGNNSSQLVETRTVRGYRSSHENAAYFGLGEQEKVDSVIIKWPSGLENRIYEVNANTMLKAVEEDAVVSKNFKNYVSTLFEMVDGDALNLDFKHKENVYNDFEKEILLPYKQSTQGPFLTVADVNNDGLEDVLVGGASGQAATLFLQNSSGKYTTAENPSFDEDKNYEDMQSVFFDLDNDGDLDLYTVSGGNEFLEFSSLYTDRVYENDGQGHFTRIEFDALNSYPKSGRTVATLDFDNDGFQDILVGNRIIPQNYPRFSPSVLLKNNNGKLIDVTSEIIPELANFGIVNDLLVSDFNNDGLNDIIAVGEWNSIGFFRNNGGTFTLETDLGFSNQKGWWFTIEETDVNKDGLPDYIAGNVGLNIKFKASEEKPFKVFANDFDDNGTPDIVLSKKYQGELVPVRGRECSSQQMPFIKEKFETYNEFANAKLIDIYGEKLETAYENEVTEFKSLVLINKGAGKFESKDLPIEAQMFPILAIEFFDFNNDGFEDCIIAGNIFETEVETPRLDAYSGLVLLSNGKDGYDPLSWSKSGLTLDGNIKDLALTKNNENILLISAQNQESLNIHRLKL